MNWIRLVLNILVVQSRFLKRLCITMTKYKEYIEWSNEYEKNHRQQTELNETHQIQQEKI